jgi:hypothetical protein
MVLPITQAHQAVLVDQAAEMVMVTLHLQLITLLDRVIMAVLDRDGMVELVLYLEVVVAGLVLLAQTEYLVREATVVTVLLLQLLVHL